MRKWLTLFCAGLVRVMQLRGSTTKCGLFVTEGMLIDVKEGVSIYRLALYEG